MTSERRFLFTCELLKEKLDVVIPEVVDGDYGFYTWPCSPVLAQYVWFHRKMLKGKSILELGAGTALPSIVAANCGAHVHISDAAGRTRTLENARKSKELNKLSDIAVHEITWGRFDPDLQTLPSIDIVFASDCFYDTKDFEDVIFTFAYFLEKNPSAEIWCTYQERSSSRSIEHLLQKWKIKCKTVSLSSFGADTSNVAGSDLPGDHVIHMYIFTSRCESVI